MTKNLSLAVSLGIAVLAMLAGTACAQDQQRKPEHRFVASTQGKVYYLLSCDAWKSLAAGNLRYFRTSADAERAGFTASNARGCAPPSTNPRIVARTGSSASCTVSRVADGDTFECRSGDRIRMLLIDAPELAQGAAGDSALRTLRSLLPIGTTVRLEFDVALRDPYERLLAYVWSGNVFVNREMVRRGVATSIVIPPNVKHIGLIRAALDSARRERRGLWRTNAFACSPSDFRAGRCR